MMMMMMMIWIVGKIGRLSSAAVDTFWRRAIGLFAFPRCRRLIALEASGGAYHRSWLSGQKTDCYNTEVHAWCSCDFPIV
jgi:hypothetical protein